jgi:hypothetical protein
MLGSRAFRSAVVVGSIFAAFIVGRSSVRPSKTSEPVEATKTRHPQSLSAITPASSDKRAERPDHQPASTQRTDPPLADQIDADLKKIAEFLAAAANEPGDLRALSETIAAWMDYDPEEAIAWLATGDRRDEILRIMFVAWGSKNPDAALAWLAANRDTDRYQSAAFGLARNLPSEEALQIAETLDEASHRAVIWAEAGVGLFAADQDAALERLAAAEFPDELERLTANSWRRALSNQSKRNAQNLASVFSSAVAAGAEFQGNSSEEIARELVAGITGGGSYDKIRFQVPELSEQEIARAIENIEFVGQDVGQNQFNYDPAPDEDL